VKLSASIRRNRVTTLLLKEVRVPNIVGMIIMAVSVVAFCRLFASDPLLLCIVLVFGALFSLGVVDTLRRKAGLKIDDEQVEEAIAKNDGDFGRALLDLVCTYQVWHFILVVLVIVPALLSWMHII
jgi:hypothetical protein